jgi:hypothetical protein
MSVPEQCIKYKTDQAADIKQVEKLNNWIFTMMSGKDAGSAMDIDGKK